jgi:hypothetical protein
MIRAAVSFCVGLPARVSAWIGVAKLARGDTAAVLDPINVARELPHLRPLDHPLPHAPYVLRDGRRYRW